MFCASTWVCEDYTTPLEASDRITLELDMDKGCLSFFRSVPRKSVFLGMHAYDFIAYVMNQSLSALLQK
jgi:hypothetical protein